MVNLDSLKGKKVFVTGHTGFKGSWMLLWLKKIGCEVYGYSLEPEVNSMFNKLNLSDLSHNCFSDIRNQEKLTKEIARFNPDVIFHLAAQPLVKKSFQQTHYTHEVNIMGTVNLLEAVRLLNHTCVVIVITTDKVYLNKETKDAFIEIDPLGGYDPYSASKAATEILVESYRHNFFNPKAYNQHGKSIASARSGNVIGGGDFSEYRIIPDIIRAIQNKDKIILRRPKAIRPWQHVLETIYGYLLLANQLLKTPDSAQFASAWNFGPEYGDSCTVEELTKKIVSIIGSGEIDYENPDFYESTHLELNSSKAQDLLFWQPKLDLEETLNFTASWYLNFLKRGQDLKDFTIQQLNQYLRL